MESGHQDQELSHPRQEPVGACQEDDTAAFDKNAQDLLHKVEHRHNVMQKVEQDIQKMDAHKALEDMNKDGPVMMCFNLLIACSIMANALYMSVALDYREDISADTNAIIGGTFTCIWIIEAVVRIVVQRKGYFTNSWYLFDFFLMCISVAESWIIPAFREDKTGGSSIWSILRVVRMIRVLRLVKLLHTFQPLWLLTNGLMRAMSVLGWMCLLLFFVMYCAGLATTMLVGKDCDDVYKDWAECYQFYGTVLRSIFTLFQVSTFESWAMVLARPVIEEKPYMIVFFILYIFATSFGLFNIMVGAIVEQTFQQSEDNSKAFQAEKLRHQLAEIKQLKDIFHEADADSSGEVNLAEFLDVCRREDVQDKFALLDLNVGRPNLARRLFEVLDIKQSGKLGISEMLERTWSLMTEGRALSEDMSLLLMETRHLSRKLTKVRRGLNLEVEKDLNYLGSSRDPQSGPGGAVTTQAVEQPEEDSQFEGMAKVLLQRFDAVETGLRTRMTALEDKVSFLLEARSTVTRV